MISVDERDPLSNSPCPICLLSWFHDYSEKEIVQSRHELIWIGALKQTQLEWKSYTYEVQQGRRERRPNFRGWMLTVGWMRTAAPDKSWIVHCCITKPHIQHYLHEDPCWLAYPMQTFRWILMGLFLVLSSQNPFWSLAFCAPNIEKKRTARNSLITSPVKCYISLKPA